VNAKDAIRTVVGLTKDLKDVSFGDLVEATSEFKLYPVDLKLPEDKELIEDLSASFRHFIAFSNKTGTRFTATRINDVSRHIEEILVEQMHKTGIKARILGESGYPDIELTDKHNRVSYLEVKISSKQKLTSFRTFYYTSGKKIKSDARHLLIGLHFSETADKHWKVEEWELIDLSKLLVSLKAEFNASNIDIFTEQARISKS
jgi:hypothetical protein